MKNKFTLWVLLAAVVLYGCEATRGAGRDIENTGENIQQGIDRTQQ